MDWRQAPRGSAGPRRPRPAHSCRFNGFLLCKRDFKLQASCGLFTFTSPFSLTTTPLSFQGLSFRLMVETCNSWILCLKLHVESYTENRGCTLLLPYRAPWQRAQGPGCGGGAGAWAVPGVRGRLRRCSRPAAAKGEPGLQSRFCGPASPRRLLVFI